MEQKSNVQYRAEKEYKNSREKFFLLLREIISNAIHAVLIRKDKEAGFIPKLNLAITFDDKEYKIELTDNGEGFNEKNQKYFEELDKKNPEKERLHFHPLGQGRLAIVYFTDFAKYETVYKDENGKYNKKTIPYPSSSEGLFSFAEFKEEEQTGNNTYTKLTILINKQQTIGRAKTFFNRYPNVNSFKRWFIETFFPFIINNEQLIINISLNGDNVIVKKNNLETETVTIPFNLQLDSKLYSFMLWLVRNGAKMHGDNPIICFARNLVANLSAGKLTYSIDNDEGYHLYLTSDFFDDYVDTKGEKIEVSCDDITSIQKKNKRNFR